MIAGVVLHLPKFLGARDVQYRLVAMPVDPGMLAGVALIVGGLARSARRRDDATSRLPAALAALAVGRFRVETHRRGLEEITAVEPHKALEAG